MNRWLLWAALSVCVFWSEAKGLTEAGATTGQSPRVYVLRGLGEQRYQVEKALHSGFQLRVSGMDFDIARAETTTLAPPFPQQLSALRDVDVVMMADVDVQSLGRDGAAVLAQFVQEGGGLVMLGGLFSFGKGHLKGSPLDSILPVQGDGVWEVRFAARALIQPLADEKLVAGLTWKPAPRLPYYHRLRPRAGSRVLLTVNDGFPVLVVGSAEKGRVAVFAGAPVGSDSASAGSVPFWKWGDWPTLLRRVVRWAAEGSP